MASQIKRRRASADEMEQRAEFLIGYAHQHGPVTVRQLFYAATVAAVPGIEKTEAGYAKVQVQVLDLRRAGRLCYSSISDSTRYMRKPHTHNGWQAALEDTARLYRKALWADSDQAVEVWLEKSALAGVLYPVTSEYDVPLMPTDGFSSETFAYGAVNALRGAGKRLVVYSLYDFDRSGQDAAAALDEKVRRFGAEFGVPVVAFRPATLEDARALIAGRCEVPVANDLAQFVWQRSRGFNREILDAIAHIERFGLRADIDEGGVTIEDMAGQPIMTDRTTGKEIHVPEAA